MSNSVRGHSEPPPAPRAQRHGLTSLARKNSTGLRKSADLNPASHLWEELGMQILSRALSFNIST